MTLPPDLRNRPSMPVIDLAVAMLHQIEATQYEAIVAAAEIFAECAAKDGLIYVFGSGHSHLLVEELFYRAGGLAVFSPILDTSLMLHESALASSATERLIGYASVILSKYQIEQNDAFLVVSYSGVNAVPIEIALEARRRGLPVVALTSVETSRALPSRQADGQRLFEVADVVLDCPGPPGDAAVVIPELDLRVCALSTITGAAILQSVVYETTVRLAARGIRPPVLVSANIPHGDAVNAEVIRRYRPRLRHL